MAKPGIKTRKPKTLMDVPLRPRLDTGEVKANVERIVNLSALETAFDEMAKRPVQKKRKGLRLLVRKLAYFVLART
jgi:hypothetical protein